METFGTVLLFMVFGLLATTGEAAVMASLYLPDSTANETAPVVKLGVLDAENAAAYAVWDDSENTTGWGQLWLTTTENVVPDDAMYAIGYLEGYMTSDTIWANYLNEKTGWFDELPSSLVTYLETNKAWMDSMIEKAKSTDTQMSSDQKKFWWAVSLCLKQLDGLLAGYNANSAVSKQFAYEDMLLLTGYIDVADLLSIFSDFEAKNDRCSCAIKLLPDLSDILVAHSTWDSYSMMTRLLKVYNLTLACSPGQFPDVNGTVCKPWSHVDSFSASPGFLSSVDDFFVLSSGMVVMESTNGNYNDELNKYIGPFTVLSWARTLVANMLGENGEKWAKFFGMFNSGTYNNQWMILDMKKFTPGKNLTDGTLTVLEQLPGKIVSEDVTSVLAEKLYWASYNIPYYPEIYNKSGFMELYLEKGDRYSHDKTARALLFKRLQGQVTGIDTMKWLIRYNNYESDEESQGNPKWSIAARGDLGTGKNFSLSGGIDGKVTSVDMAWLSLDESGEPSHSLNFFAVNGPTTQDQPVFEWKAEYNETSHLGQPDVFDFDWITFGPNGL